MRHPDRSGAPPVSQYPSAQRSIARIENEPWGYGVDAGRMSVALSRVRHTPRGRHVDATRNAMPAGVLSGWAGDTGLDIAGSHVPVFAIAAGTLDYAESGYTRWTAAKDNAFSVRLRLGDPFPRDSTVRTTCICIMHVFFRAKRQPSQGAPRSASTWMQANPSGLGNRERHNAPGLGPAARRSRGSRIVDLASTRCPGYSDAAEPARAYR
jgi:hypothetical protein